MARIPLPQGARYEQLSFFAQQAAEKAVKAVLLDCNIDFPFIHNLRVLVGLLPTDMQSAAELAGAETLSTYAVTTRYPWDQDEEPVGAEEHDKAVRIADAVVQWAAAVIEAPRQRAGEDE